MKTIHTISKSKTLIRRLYKEILLKDQEFHFFYEPELIIRTNKINEITNYLEKNKIKFKIYDYPIVKDKNNAKSSAGIYCYECDKIVINNLDLFLPLYHLYSLFALKFTKKILEEKILDRLIHTIFNPCSYSYNKEGNFCLIHGIGQKMIPFELAIDNQRALLRYFACYLNDMSINSKKTMKKNYENINVNKRNKHKDISKR